ncbi:MAG TPA: DUF748 domain-containing protein [Candidatus Polarisedimenticolaceae bacterium]
MTRRAKGVVAGVAAVGLYAAFGFLILPGIVRSVAVDRLGKLTGRSVSIAKVRTNPFAVSVTVRDLKVVEPGGEILLGFDRLYANADILHRLTGWWAFDAIEVDGARGLLVQRPDGSFNVTDIAKRWQETPRDPGPTSPPAPLRIDRVRVAGATLAFRDETRAPAFGKVLGPYSFSVDAFRSEGREGGRHAFQAKTESGETLAWDGTLAMAPLRSEGDLKVEGVDVARYAPYFADAVGFDLKRARFDLKTGYRVSLDPASRAFVLEGLETTLREIRLTERGSDESVFESPEIKVAGASVDLFGRRAEIPAVESSAGRLLIRIGADGTTNLERLAPRAEAKPAPEARPFSVHVGRVAFTGYAARFEDLQTPRPIGVDLKDVSVEAKDASTDATSRPDLTVRLGFDNGGTVEATGQIALRALAGSARATLVEVPLAPFDAYLEDTYALRIVDGTASGAGEVTFDFGKPEQAVFEYRGDLALDGLRALDAATTEEFLRWKGVALAGVAFTADPPSLALKSITIAGPGLRVVVREDGRTNLADVLRVPVAPPEGRVDEEADAPEPETPVVEPTVDAPALERPVTIGRVTIRDAAVALVDRRTEPDATFRLDSLAGTLDRISTDDLSRGDASFTGKFDGVAPFRIEGRINPLIAGENSDFTVTARGIEMTRFGPYAEKWLGWTIARGKLDLDLRYAIASRKLTATNVATFLPLELGEKTASPDATKLPVKLGLALLRDGDGKIVVDLPIEGSLDDPKFRVRRVVLRALVTVFKKAATSPFKLLAGLGGGDDAGSLDRVAFAPGVAAIDPAEQGKLASLAGALAARPGLSLEISGGAGGEADLAALRRAALPPEPAPTADALAAVAIAEGTLRSLADARATAVRDWLVGAGGLDPSRVRLAGAAEAEPGVRFSLSD